MNYRNIANQTLQAIGGKDNIVSAAHCATRLRLVIADNKLCNKKTIENIDGVKGVFEASGQLQIIFGTGSVNKVYAEFIDLANISEASKDEVKQAAASKEKIWKRAIKTLGDIFVPIIPAIVASGLLMGLLEGFCNLYPALASSSLYTIIHLFSNAAFVFLPILVAMSSAKTFKGNIFLGAVIGMIMIHPDLINAWSVSGLSADAIPTASVFFGLYDINLVGYQGHVIPVIVAVWLMCKIENKLHKIVPEIIDLFVTPLVSVLVTGYLTLTIIGPIFSTLETWVLSGASALITLPFGIGSALVGGFYAPTVVAGLHHMYNAIEAGMLSANGLNIWMPVATAANVAQGAACLAVGLKTKNKKTKAVALPASLSAYLGITEPAIFGVNMRFMKAFIAGCIGGACGGLVAGIFNVGASAYGITGVFGFLITTNYTLQYALILIVSTVVAFALSWILHRDEQSDEEVSVNENKDVISEKVIIDAPLAGKVVSLQEVNDESFKNELLGKGVAIIPSEGKVVAPFDGKIEVLFPSKHAIAMKNEAGVEVLIHIGLDTVQLDGLYYESYVQQGDEVKKGDVLVSFDIEAIKKAGYDVITPVIITNSDNYNKISGNLTNVEMLDTLLEIA